MKNVSNVFLLILDIHTGLVFAFPAESRGQASVGLQAYIKKYGVPKEIIHDNGEEFIHGEFADLCTQHNIAQTPSPPYEPNKNPVELYMDILMSMARSMLFISGLKPETFRGNSIRTRSTNTDKNSLTWPANTSRIDSWPPTQCRNLTDFWVRGIKLHGKAQTNKTTTEG